MNPITVSVTREDLGFVEYKGTFRDGIFGPLARAIKRTLKADDVLTFGACVFADGKCYDFSQPAIMFVLDWNAGRECHPFTFQITEAKLDPSRTYKDHLVSNQNVNRSDTRNQKQTP
jgi:hypothetical protein